MKKEFVGKVLGENFRVLEIIDLGNGLKVKVKKDDWGKYLIVVDEDRNIHFDGPVMSDYNEFERFKQMVIYRYK